MSKIDKLFASIGGNMRASLGARTTPAPAPTTTAKVMPTTTASPRDGVRANRAAGYVDLKQVVADPNQPRREFEPGAIEALAASIKSKGILQPLRVRWEPEQGKYVLIAGERRYRAALLAGLESVPVVWIEGTLSPAEVLEEQLIENLLRADLKPIEQANAFHRLIELRNCTARELAGLLGVDAATISRALALLKLDPEIQAEVEAGQITPTTATEIARVEDPEVQRELAQAVVEQDLSREETIERVLKTRQKKIGGKKPKTTTATFKTSSKGKVVVTFQKAGVDEASIILALEEALAQARAAQAA